MFSPFPDRRSILLAAPSLLIVGRARSAPPGPVLTVFRNPGCGCCLGWISHMARAGFSPRVVDTDDLAPVRAKYHTPPKLASCHTALVGGYVIEGHVPAADVTRLLRERPVATGIAAPGMPRGAPGMEMPDGKRQSYQVILFGPGRTSVFATHV
jgi:hypothetical protein